MEFLSIFSIFVMACFVGYYVVWSVTPALHTPLMAVTNAISSVIVVGALIASSAAAGGSEASRWLGLLAVVLSMTMVMMTSVAVARERERGTMENLLAMPLRPSEVMIGKILPYVLIGAAQTALILTAARLIFDVPFVGSVVLLGGVTMLFIVVSLLLGFTISTIVATQLQAMQMSFFYILPSILLSGFMFPFYGMPAWARGIGEAIPVTHFLRLVRGIMLKGWALSDAVPEMLVLAAMAAVLAVVATRRYGSTLS